MPEPLGDSRVGDGQVRDVQVRDGQMKDSQTQHMMFYIPGDIRMELIAP